MQYVPCFDCQASSEWKSEDLSIVLEGHGSESDKLPDRATKSAWTLLVSLQAIDRFINGDFYRHPLSAEAILDVAEELRVCIRPASYFRFAKQHDVGLV